MRIVFELKRGEQAEVVLNNLYKHTQMQINFGVIMLSHRQRPAARAGPDRRASSASSSTASMWSAAAPITCCAKRASASTFCSASRKRSIIWTKSSSSSAPRRTPREAREGLIAAFEFTEKQAQAIIELQLQRLTGMEQQKILDELADIQRTIAEYLEILGSDKVLRDADRQRTEGSPEGLRRRAPHRDHRRHRRDHGSKTWCRWKTSPSR